MLVLTRCTGERILIGDDVVITVVRMNRDGSVRLGIEAPKDIPVDREEFRKRKLAGEVAPRCCDMTTKSTPDQAESSICETPIQPPST